MTPSLTENASVGPPVLEIRLGLCSRRSACERLGEEIREQPAGSTAEARHTVLNAMRSPPSTRVLHAARATAISVVDVGVLPHNLASLWLTPPGVVSCAEPRLRQADTVLCYDVSRFSRLDPEEAGFHEYSLRRAGVRVIYTHEPGANEAGITGHLVKSLKRVLAPCRPSTGRGSSGSGDRGITRIS